MEKVKLQCHLKEILKERGLSEKKLSEEIGERTKTINDLANNKDMNSRRIPASLLAKLLSYLGVSFDEIFTVVKEEQSKKPN